MYDKQKINEVNLNQHNKSILFELVDNKENTRSIAEKN